MVGRGPRRGPTGLASGAVEPSRIVAVSCTGQWASHRAGRRRRACRWATASCGRTPGAGATPGRPSAGRSPGTPRWRPAVDPPLGWRAVAGGRRPGGAHPGPRARPARVAAAARWYLEPVDYLTMRFTGVAAATHASMSGGVADRQPAAGRHGLRPGAGGAGRGPGRPSSPRWSPSARGRRGPGDVAADLGFPPGSRWWPAPPTSTRRPRVRGGGRAPGALRHLHHLWVSCPVPARRRPRSARWPPCPGLSTGGYLVANNHDTGGRALEWARTLARSRTPARLRRLTDLAAEVRARCAAGCCSPRGWPASGRRSTTSARGGFHNLSLGTSQSQLVRAVLEGVAFNCRWLSEAVEPFVGRRLEVARVMGGGAGSDLWCRIHADVLGRTVERVADPVPANLRGAALLAGLALGDLAPDEVRSLCAGRRGVRAPTRPPGPSTTTSSPSSPASTGPSGGCSGPSTADGVEGAGTRRRPRRERPR